MSSTTPVTPDSLEIGQRVWIEREFCWTGTRFIHEWQEGIVAAIVPSPYVGDSSTTVYIDGGTWTDYVTFDAVQLAQPVAEMEAAL